MRLSSSRWQGVCFIVRQREILFPFMCEKTEHIRFNQTAKILGSLCRWQHTEEIGTSLKSCISWWNQCSFSEVLIWWNSIRRRATWAIKAPLCPAWSNDTHRSGPRAACTSPGGVWISPAPLCRRQPKIGGLSPPCYHHGSPWAFWGGGGDSVSVMYLSDQRRMTVNQREL